MKRSPLKAKTPLRAKSGLKSNTQLKRGGSMKRVRVNGKSKKQKLIDESYAKKKREVFDQDQLCTGCQSSNNPTASHLIPRSKRSDLIDDMDNVKPHCLKCHDKWESLECVHLLDFEDNFKYLYRMDEGYFWLRMSKLIDHWKGTSESKRISNLLKELGEE